MCEDEHRWESLKKERFHSACSSNLKQGRIHGNPVADEWAGAEMQKPLAILEIFVTDRPTQQGVESRVRD